MGTYRDLLYTGEAMDVAAFTARSGERGYIGYTITVDVADESRHCNCTCPAKAGTCWHVKEAPKALFYVQQREKFRQMGDAFGAFFDEWWPRYQTAVKGEQYLGKTCAEWELFFAALLDERNERSAYTRKYVGQMREILGELEEVSE